MLTAQLQLHLPVLALGLFVVALGACVGSLVNVVVYRVPRGISVVLPPSRCPTCGTRLAWRDNIPVLGWLLLCGRCRYCHARISPEYPIVEALSAALFGLLYVVWFVLPPDWSFLGVPWGAMRPEWALNPPRFIWPTFLVLLTLVGSLLAMTLIDARTYTIPLPLCWIPTIVAVVVHPAWAAWIECAAVPLRHVAPHQRWMIPLPPPEGWHWLTAAAGALVGLGVSNALVATGLMRRSFADFEAWVQQHAARTRPTQPADPRDASARPSTPDPPPHDSPAQEWIAYPHARREMIRELAFLAPCAALALVGWRVGATLASGPMPLWLAVLGGVAMGYLIGGGVVWTVRILGSFAFGKEAMGMGDVHLMAAVGAALGWIDATLAFFGAAFVGVAWVVLGLVLGGRARRALPYGPYLAVATLLVVLAKPAVELGLSRLAGVPVNLP